MSFRKTLIVVLAIMLVVFAYSAAAQDATEEPNTDATPEVLFQAAADATEEASVDCRDPQQGFVTNDPLTGISLLQYLQQDQYIKYIDLIIGIPANQVNQSGRIATIANVLSYVQDNLRDKNILNQAVSMHFEYSNEAMEAFAPLDTDFKDVTFWGIFGTFDYSDWTTLEQVDLVGKGGMLVVVYKSGYTEDTIRAEVMSEFIDMRAAACPDPVQPEATAEATEAFGG